MDRFGPRFQRVLVAQAILDDVNQAINETQRAKPQMVLGKEGEQYLRQEITPEDIQRRTQFLIELRDAILLHTEVVPVYNMLDLNRQEFEEIGSLIGRGSMASMLLAQAQGMILASDDFGLRALATNDWQVQGCWTQALLIDLYSSKRITTEEYHDAVRKFIVSHFRHTFINLYDLMWILEKNRYSPTDEVMIVTAIFQGEHCDEDAAIALLSEAVKRLWLKPLLPNQRLGLLDQMLLSLVAGRNGARVLRLFKEALESCFQLIPTHLPWLIRNIDIWAEQRVLIVKH